jgi:hypothetical protein
LSRNTPIEKIWARIGGTQLKKLYEARKRRHVLSMNVLGEALDYKKKSQVTSVRNLMEGNTNASPELIINISEKLSEYDACTEGSFAKKQSQQEIESLLAIYSGKQMPSLLDLDEDVLSETLATLSNLSLLMLRAASYRSEDTSLHGLAWFLAIKEINQIAIGWLEICSLLDDIQATTDFDEDVGESHEKSLDIFNKWNRIDEQLSKLNAPLQTAFANVIWAQSLAWGGNTQIAESKAEKALRLLRDVKQQKEEELLKYYALIINGDNHRARGQINLAIEKYQEAQNVIPGGKYEEKLSNNITLKKINTYLLAHIQPQHWLVDQIRVISNSFPDPSVRARALFALAWIERSRYGSGIENSKKYSVEGLQLAQEANDTRAKANGLQYLGDAYLQCGELEKAKDNLLNSISLITKTRSGRKGYSKLLLGLVYSYGACVLYETHGLPLSLQISNTASHLLKEAENHFREMSAHIESGSSVYQLKRLLIEDAKINSIFSLMRRESQQDTGGVFLLNNFDSARRKLDEARSFLWLSTRDFYKETIQVTSLLIDYFEWLVMRSEETFSTSLLEERITEQINRMNSLATQPIDLTPDARYFERVFYGDLGILHVMRGVLRLNMVLDGSGNAENDFKQSAYFASQYNFLAIENCRVILYLAVGFDSQKMLFDNNLKISDKEKLRKFLLLNQKLFSN